MGHPKILLRQTSLLRKSVGQLKKFTDSYKQAKKKETGRIKTNSTPYQVDGVPEFMAQNKGAHYRQITRRQIVLNRTFTEVISDVLSTNMGEVIQESKVTITSIETKAWDRGIRIFYLTEDLFDRAIHDRLNSLCSQLRSAISEQVLMGKVPLVFFVYDHANAKLRDLDLIFDKIVIKEDNVTDLVNMRANDLQTETTKSCESRSRLEACKFDAPSDMQNRILGLDYPKIYDSIVPNLARGRGQSARMLPEATLAQQVKPFIRLPHEEAEDGEDPSLRLAKMQNFIVNQRKKDEYHGKIRRKEQLLYRDKVKWDLPEETREEIRNLDDPNEDR